MSMLKLRHKMKISDFDLIYHFNDDREHQLPWVISGMCMTNVLGRKRRKSCEIQKMGYPENAAPKSHLPGVFSATNQV